jgi:hypothetical protein
MKKSFIPLILFSFILAHCTEQDESADQIHYSDLPGLPVELIAEAGESESYFPSRLNDLYVNSEGHLLVSDWGSVTLEQFTPEGEHIQTIATKGGGPGELPDFFFMADAGSNRLIVEHQGARRDFFEPDNRGIYTYMSTISASENGQFGYNLVGKRADNQYYASPRNVIRDVQSLLVNPEDYRTGTVAIIDDSFKPVQDSLITLKTPLPHLTDAGNGGFRVDMVPYRNTDRFITLKNGEYLVARPEKSRLEFYDIDHNLIKEIELNIAPREITESDLDYAFRNLRQEVIRAIKPRVHEFKPPFLDILASENHLWLHIDNREEGKDFVVLDMAGNPAGKFLLSEYDEVNKVIENRIYTLHKNPDVGHSVRIYEVEI